jgi:hypothetical protein
MENCGLDPSAAPSHELEPALFRAGVKITLLGRAQSPLGNKPGDRIQNHFALGRLSHFSRRVTTASM